MLYSFSFNGIKKPYLYTEKGKQSSPFAPITRNIQTVPGRAGGYLTDSETQIRVIQQPIFIKADNRTNLRKLEEDLSAWLVTKEPMELIFDDEKDRVYYAVVEESIELEQVDEFARGVITFICPDPYKYSKDEYYTEFSNEAVINVAGTTETHPVVEIEVKERTTYLAISNGEDINIVGNPAAVTEQPFERKTKVYESQLTTTQGWSVPASVEGGEVTGTIKSDGFLFYSDNYGSGGAWHGGALKQSIGASVQDFELEVNLQQYAFNLVYLGLAEVSVLDASNKVVAKVSMRKVYQGLEVNYGLVRAGSMLDGKDIIDSYGSVPSAWNNFKGVLKISRIGNQWEAYISKVDQTTGKHDTATYRTWIDNSNTLRAPITQVQTYLATYALASPTLQNMDSIRVYRINNPNSNQIPYIASPGDIITFDHKNDVILKNGEAITKEKAFTGEYFPLNPGQNAIVIEPESAIDKSVIRWRNKWL